MISIFYIFDEYYDRKIRVLDFYLRLVLPILFNLMKLYIEGNPEYESLKNKRDMRYRNFTPDSFIPSITKVIFLYIDFNDNTLWNDICYYITINTSSS